MKSVITNHRIEQFMKNENIPLKYFMSDVGEIIQLEAQEFVDYLPFILGLDADKLTEREVIEACIQRIINFAIMENHLSDDYADDYDGVFTDVYELLTPVKGVYIEHFNHLTIEVLLKELFLVLDEFTFNPWGIYSTIVKYPNVYLQYFGDYRIIKWSMSNEGKKYQHKEKGIKYLISETVHTFRKL